MGSSRAIFSFAGGVIIGAGVTALLFLNAGNLPQLPFTEPATASDSTTTSPVEQASGSVTVSDQGAGMSVSIASLTVPPPGVWVAVREMDGSDLGNVLGALKVGGPRSNFVVPLLRATAPGERYAVELYRDDAGGGFDSGANSVYIDFDTGVPAISYFSTTAASTSAP